MQNRKSSLIGMLLVSCILAMPAVAENRLGVMSGQRWVDDVQVNDVATGVDESQSISALIEWNYTAVADWQVYVSKFETDIEGSSSGSDLDFTIAQIGGLRWTDTGTFRPYVGGTGGATMLDAGGDSLTRLSLSFFAGLNWDLGKSTAIRTEARWIGTFIDSDTGLLCVNGLCRVNVESGVWSQTEVAAAFVLRF